MKRYKYKALNTDGRIIRGNIAANSDVDLHQQLEAAGLDLIDCSVINDKGSLSLSLGKKKVKLRDLVQIFIQMDQMQSAGVPLLETLSDVRDSTDHDGLRDIMAEVFRDVSEGLSLSESMAKHPKVFKPLYVSLIAAGEETGNMTSSYQQLIKYIKWTDVIQSKVKKASRYPIIVTVVILFTIVFMMSVVVPQIVGFLQFLDLPLPWFTIALIATSDFMTQTQLNVFGLKIVGAVVVLAVPALAFAAVKLLRKSSSSIDYMFDSWYLRAPLIGPLIRKISIARYAQTFGALYSSGIDVLSGLEAARSTVTNKMMVDAMQTVEMRVKAGSALSEAFNVSGEFPSLVVRMVKVGEESGNITAVLDQVAEFYTKDVNEAIDGLIELIQPTLTLILALVIVWIAAGSLGPIYLNLGKFMDF